VFDVGGTLRRAANGLLDALLPQCCAGCGRSLAGGGLLCAACLAAIPRLSFDVCARCLAAGRDPAGCRVHPDFAVWPAWVYDRRAEEFVHALKFGRRPGLARGLGPELGRAAAHLAAADCVTEVPLHRARQRERGYNQAALLAGALGAELGVPYAPGVLARTRPTRAQARLGARERRDNLRGAFRLARPDWARGRRVIIVDDVITSGATLEACLAALTEAKARPVAVTLAWAQ
jgi:ComF family protein